MSRGIEQIGDYVQQLERLQYRSCGNLSRDTAMRMLAVLKCLEAALTAYLIKLRL